MRNGDEQVGAFRYSDLARRHEARKIYQERKTRSEVVEAIAAIPVTAEVNGYSRVTTEQAIEIAALLDGDSEMFWDLDNHPPRSATGEEWHWKLRQSRNNHPEFWTRLQEDAAKKGER